MSEQVEPEGGKEPKTPATSSDYEPPEIEDLSAPNGPSVTAAGGPSIQKAAPREL